ncbi:uncharacterized protein TNCV_2085661 [Trichonephila clavipes]|nr:uncharacterized protein TNCV_2085661 [Trichonephila clavipes]
MAQNYGVCPQKPSCSSQCDVNIHSLTHLDSVEENKEKFILYLTLSLSIALVAVLAILTTKFYLRRSRRLREERGAPSKPPLPTDVPGTGGGISPFGDDCTDLDHFDSGVEVVRFAARSSLRRAQPIEEDDCSFPRAPVRAQNNYYYS